MTHYPIDELRDSLKKKREAFCGSLDSQGDAKIADFLKDSDTKLRQAQREMIDLDLHGAMEGTEVLVEIGRAILASDKALQELKITSLQAMGANAALESVALARSAGVPDYKRPRAKYALTDLVPTAKEIAEGNALTYKLQALLLTSGATVVGLLGVDSSLPIPEMISGR